LISFFFFLFFWQFVFVSLAGWGALFYSGYKYFTSGSTTPKPANEEATASKPDHHANPKAKTGKH
jgi:threonine/homoserine/homoserine lactone efflux protein